MHLQSSQQQSSFSPCGCSSRQAHTTRSSKNLLESVPSSVVPSVGRKQPATPATTTTPPSRPSYIHFLPGHLKLKKSTCISPMIARPALPLKSTDTMTSRKPPTSTSCPIANLFLTLIGESPASNPRSVSHSSCSPRRSRKQK